MVGKHTDWKNSEAKAYIVNLFETGQLNPKELPDLKSLHASNPALFAAYDQRNFSNNVRNLAKKYKDKFYFENEDEDEDKDKDKMDSFGGKLFYWPTFLFYYDLETNYFFRFTN